MSQVLIASIADSAPPVPCPTRQHEGCISICAGCDAPMVNETHWVGGSGFTTWSVCSATKAAREAYEAAIVAAGDAQAVVDDLNRTPFTRAEDVETAYSKALAALYMALDAREALRTVDSQHAAWRPLAA